MHNTAVASGQPRLSPSRTHLCSRVEQRTHAERRASDGGDVQRRAAAAAAAGARVHVDAGRRREARDARRVVCA